MYIELNEPNQCVKEYSRQKNEKKTLKDIDEPKKCWCLIIFISNIDFESTRKTPISLILHGNFR